MLPESVITTIALHLYESKPMKNKAAKKLRAKNSPISGNGYSWNPKVIDGGEQSAGDIERQELWDWYVARIKALSGYDAEQVKLTALLGWTEGRMSQASCEARIDTRCSHFTGEVPDSYRAYLAADYMARKALHLETPETKCIKSIGANQTE